MEKNIESEEYYFKLEFYDGRAITFKYAPDSKSPQEPKADKICEEWIDSIQESRHILEQNPFPLWIQNK